VEGSVRAKNKLDLSSCVYTTVASGGDKGGASDFLGIALCLAYYYNQKRFFDSCFPKPLTGFMDFPSPSSHFRAWEDGEGRAGTGQRGKRRGIIPHHQFLDLPLSPAFDRWTD